MTRAKADTQFCWGKGTQKGGKGQINPKNFHGLAKYFVKVIESIARPQKDCTGHCIVAFLGELTQI